MAVVEQELRDLWAGARGLLLSFGFSVLLSAIAYLTATNTDLNFLEQREAVNLTLQVAIAAGGLLTLLVAADAISGERERGTLESLLLTPAPRARLVGGKLLAALTLWPVSLAIAVPYVWVLGRGAGTVGDALATGLAAGTLVAVALASLGIVVSLFAASNRVSLSVSLFALLALYAPTQLPAGVEHGWAGELLMRVNPVTAGEHYVGRVVVDGDAWGTDAAWLASPLAAAVAGVAAALLLGSRCLRLEGAGPR